MKIREKYLLISFDVDWGGVPFELYNFVYTRDQEDGTLINWQRLKLFSWLPGLQTDKQAWRWDISSIFPSGIEQRHEQHKPSSVFWLWGYEAIDRFWKRGGAPSTDTAIAPLPSSKESSESNWFHHHSDKFWHQVFSNPQNSFLLTSNSHQLQRIGGTDDPLIAYLLIPIHLSSSLLEYYWCGSSCWCCAWGQSWCWSCWYLHEEADSVEESTWCICRCHPPVFLLVLIRRACVPKVPPRIGRYVTLRQTLSSKPMTASSSSWQANKASRPISFRLSIIAYPDSTAG